MSAESPTRSHGKLKPGGSEPICMLTTTECEPAVGCLVEIPKDHQIREKLEIGKAFDSIQHYAFVAATSAFKDSSHETHVVICRGYTNTGNKKFNIKPGHKKIVAPEIGSSQNSTWLLMSCQEGLKGSRMRKFLKDLQIVDEEDPSQICKNNPDLVGIGVKDDQLVYQPFKVIITDDETFCVSRESFKTLKPSGPVLDKEKNHVLGYYWSRENKMIISWLARGWYKAMSFLKFINN